MRMLQNSRIVEAPLGWREQVEADGRPVVLDLGAGDGRFSYESARHDPASLYIAVDPDADSLKTYAFKAGRKPARGGVENAIFIVAGLEALPAALHGIAARVRVNFPWGSLMHGLLQPDAEALRRLAALLRPDGEIEVITSYQPEHDTRAFAAEPLPPLDTQDIEERLAPAYAAAGFPIRKHRRLTADEAISLPSTWGRRLLHARPRDVYYLVCVPTDTAIG